MKHDYEKLELKAGLEIHQQLNTNKLFCNCPSLLRSDEPIYTIKRTLNPVIGETGKIDIAAEHESQKNKNFIYQVYDTNCLVELDEEPPHKMNKEALQIALQIAHLLNCKIFPVTQVMRKTVIDGSNTSGFQRTALIAHDGFIETKDGKVRIETIAIEEDSARKISEKENAKLTTSMKSSKSSLGVGEGPPRFWGSPSGGEQTREIPNDRERGDAISLQEKTIISPDKNDTSVEQATSTAGGRANTRNEKATAKMGEADSIKTFKLDRLGIPLVEITTMPDLKNPKQIKEAALKIGEILRACNVKRGIGTIRQDVNISIRGSKRVEIKGFQDPKMMTETIDKEIERQIDCLKNKNCKKEVRNALPDGSTKFLRPMPGSSRMYPETDLPLLKISKQLVDETKKNLPKLTHEHKSFLDEFGLNENLVKLIVKQKKVEELKFLLNVTKDAELIAKTLTIFQTEIAKKQNLSKESQKEIFNIHTLEDILERVGSEISKNEVKTIMQKLARGTSLEKALEKSDIDLKSEVEKLIKEKPNLSQGAYMGLIMNKLKGKVSGKEVSEELEKVLG